MGLALLTIWYSQDLMHVSPCFETGVASAGPISVSLPFPPSGGTAGICNSYLPSDTTFNRFMYVVQFLARNGFYLLLVRCPVAYHRQGLLLITPCHSAIAC